MVAGHVASIKMSAVRVRRRAAVLPKGGLKHVAKKRRAVLVRRRVIELVVKRRQRLPALARLAQVGLADRVIGGGGGREDDVDLGGGRGSGNFAPTP